MKGILKGAEWGKGGGETRWREGITVTWSGQGGSEKGWIQWQWHALDPIPSFLLPPSLLSLDLRRENLLQNCKRIYLFASKAS